MGLVLKAEIPDIEWPPNFAALPPTPVILDLLEFCYRAIAKPTASYYHSFFRHSHLAFDTDEGQRIFRDEMNTILERNRLAYELDADGQVIRLAPEVLREALSAAIFRTGDKVLDRLLESAREKYLDPDLLVRQDALEKLWDAWERLKTIEKPGKDKKESMAALLDKAARDPKLRETLDAEAKELTELGNSFRIRHSETSQTPLESSDQVDYLFHRMFAMIRLLLQASGRGG